MPRSAWILCLVAMTASASAQSAHVQAEALFREGKELMAQQKIAEACAAFESSHRLEPNISTLLNHANCREKNAQLATAWGLFVDAERQTRDKADSTSKQLNVTAAERAAKLQARLSKLALNVPPDNRLDGLEILRGEDRVDPTTWNLSLPVDGGTYKIMARAPGHATWSTTVTVKPEGDVQTIAVPRLVPEAATPGSAHATGAGTTGATSPGPTSGEPAAPGPENQPRGSLAKRSLALPIAMGSAALILGGAAFAFSRWGDSIYADAKREPDDARQEALWKSANKRRYAAIGFGAGATGCVGAAIYLYLRGDREKAQPVARRSLYLDPIATASSMGLDLRGAW